MVWALNQPTNNSQNPVTDKLSVNSKATIFGLKSGYSSIKTSFKLFKPQMTLEWSPVSIRYCKTTKNRRSNIEVTAFSVLQDKNSYLPGISLLSLWFNPEPFEVSSDSIWTRKMATRLPWKTISSTIFIIQFYWYLLRRTPNFERVFYEHLETT